jgi:hypothetical protein
MVGLKADHKTITGKFSKQAENALSDERFRPVEFAFDVTTWGHNAQTRLFHIFAAYVTVMDEYAGKGFVPRNLVEIAKMCKEIKIILDEHIAPQKQWMQDEIGFTQL